MYQQIFCYIEVFFILKHESSHNSTMMYFSAVFAWEWIRTWWHSVYIYNRVTARIQGFNISMKLIRTIICLNLNLHCWSESAWLHLWQHFKVLTTLFNPIFIQHCFSGFVFVHETWSARMSMHECKVTKGRMCSSIYCIKINCNQSTLKGSVHCKLDRRRR